MSAGSRGHSDLWDWSMQWANPKPWKLCRLFWCVGQGLEANGGAGIDTCTWQVQTQGTSVDCYFDVLARGQRQTEIGMCHRQIQSHGTGLDFSVICWPRVHRDWFVQLAGQRPWNCYRLYFDVLAWGRGLVLAETVQMGMSAAMGLMLFVFGCVDQERGAHRDWYVQWASPKPWRWCWPETESQHRRRRRLVSPTLISWGTNQAGCFQVCPYVWLFVFRALVCWVS